MVLHEKGTGASELSFVGVTVSGAVRPAVGAPVESTGVGGTTGARAWEPLWRVALQVQQQALEPVWEVLQTLEPVPAVRQALEPALSTNRACQEDINGSLAADEIRTRLYLTTSTGTAKAIFVYLTLVLSVGGDDRQ